MKIFLLWLRLCESFNMRLLISSTLLFHFLISGWKKCWCQSLKVNSCPFASRRWGWCHIMTSESINKSLIPSSWNSWWMEPSISLNDVWISARSIWFVIDCSTVEWGWGLVKGPSWWEWSNWWGFFRVEVRCHAAVVAFDVGISTGAVCLVIDSFGHLLTGDIKCLLSPFIPSFLHFKIIILMGFLFFPI